MSLEPYLPPDFESFWSRTVDEALDAKLVWSRARATFSLLGFSIDTLTFKGVIGEPLSGWVAVPDQADGGRAFLWIPPYGRESLLPNDFGTRPGFVSMSFNFFGLDAFHEETYRVDRGYFAEGVESPDTWVFRRMAQNAIIAARVLREQAEVDSDRVAAAGMSQGAGISIWLGAQSGLVRAVCADMPFLGAMPYALNRTAHRYPVKELFDRAATLEGGIERIAKTISYFDTLNQATKCHVPTQVSLGLKDPAVRPEAAEAVFNALPGKKRLFRYGVGHDWYPDMVPNNLEWMKDNLP